MFLRIGDWNAFISSAILSFMVEFGGVYWVTQGNQVFRQVQTRLSNVLEILCTTKFCAQNYNDHDQLPKVERHTEPRAVK